MKKPLINRLGLLGLASLLSYTAAVAIAPLAYPGYDWKRQAVSDLSAAGAPSLSLWNQLNCLYEVCGILCVMLVCIYVRGRLNRTARIGIYLFAAMEWLSGVGCAMFPLSGGGSQMAFQCRAGADVRRRRWRECRAGSAVRRV